MLKQKKKYLFIFKIILPVYLLFVAQNAQAGQNPLEQALGQTNKYIIEFKGSPLSKIKNKSTSAISKIESTKRQYKSLRNRLRDDVEDKSKQNLISAQSKIPYKIKKDFYYLINGISVEISLNDLRELRKLPYIKNIYPDRQVTAVLEDSPHIINADYFRQSTNNYGANMVIAVIDTGIDYLHPDLGGGIGPNYKVIGGYDFINDDNDPMDDNGHGTHCAGIIAAKGTLNGIAPEAKLLAYKVLNVAGSGIFSDIISALERAADPDNNPVTDDKADIVSISIGGYGDPDDILSVAVDNATAAGMLCVIAAGNEGDYSSITSPGCARTALTVGASDKSNKMAYFSSKGPTNKIVLPKPDVVAPGVDIRSTLPDESYGIKSGTSMATPHVSGAAALIWQTYPNLTPADIKNILKQTSVNIGYNAMTQGSGLINLASVISATAVISPSVVYLGAINPSDTDWFTQTNITIKNLSNANKVFNLSWHSSIYTGLNVVFPSSISLNAGESLVVPVSVAVDNAQIPALAEVPYTYEGSILFKDNDTSISYKAILIFQKEKADPFEPNNIITQPSIENISINRHIIKGDGKTKIDPYSGLASNPDIDYFKFYAESGDYITLDIDALDIGSPLNASMVLYNQSGVQITSNSDYYSHPDPMIRDYIIPPAGTGYYTVKVNGSTNTTGNYHLIASKQPKNILWSLDQPYTGEVKLLDQGSKALIVAYNSIKLLDNQNLASQIWEITNNLSLVTTETSKNSTTICALNNNFSNYQVITYDASSPLALWQYTFPPTHIPYDLAVSDNGLTISVYCEDSSKKNIVIYVFDKSSGLPEFIFTQPTAKISNNGFDVSANGSLILFSDDEKTYILDRFSRSLRWSGSSPVRAFTINSDGTYIVGASTPYVLTLRKWDGQSYRKVWDFNSGNGQTIDSYAVSADGSVIAMGQRLITGYGGLEDKGLECYFFNKSSNTPLYQYTVQKNLENVPKDDYFGIKLPNTFKSIEVSPDNKMIAVATWGGDPEQPEVLVFSPDYPKPIGSYYAHGSVGGMSLNNNFLCFYSEGRHFFHFFKYGMDKNIVSINLNDFTKPIAPFIKETSVTPITVQPGQPITISANVSDSDGVSVVTAEVSFASGGFVGSLPLNDQGIAPDTTQGDGVYSGSYVTNYAQENDFKLFIKAKDNLNNTAVSDDNYFSTKPSPEIILLNAEIENDSALRPGKKTYIRFTFKNIGAEPSGNITLSMLAQDSYITDYYIGDINLTSIPQNQQLATQSGSLFITPAYDTPDGYSFKIKIKIQGSYNLSWQFQPVFQLEDTIAPNVSGSSVSPKYLQAGNAVYFRTTITDGSKINQANITIMDKDSVPQQPLQTLTLYDDGQHNDEYENDGVFAASWLTLQTPKDYIINVFTQDLTGNNRIFENQAQFTTKPFISNYNLLLVDDTVSEPATISTYKTDLQSVGINYDLWETEAQGEINSGVINQYKNGIVIWTVGNPSTIYQLSTEEQDIIIDYLNSGGNLLLCGQHLSYAMTVLGQQKNTLLNDYLSAKVVFKDTNCLKVTGINGNQITAGKSYTLSEQYYTGEIDPILPAVTFLKYDILNGSGVTYSSASAAIQKDTNAYRSIFMDFDFSGLKTNSSRQSLLSGIINHFSSPKINSVVIYPKILTPSGQTTISAEILDNDGIQSASIIIKDNSGVEVESLVLFDDGTHSDLTANDHVYTNTWTTPSTANDFFANVLAVDSLGNQAKAASPAFFSTRPQPDIIVTAVTPYNATHFAPGKTTYFDIAVKNTGTLGANSLKATCKITDPYVQYYSTSEKTIPTVNVNQTLSTQNGAFYINLSTSAPDKRQITMRFTFKGQSNKTFEHDFIIEVKDTSAPVLSSLKVLPKSASAGSYINISASVLDGKDITQAKVNIYTKNKEKQWELNLYDDGQHNDSLAGDKIFANNFKSDQYPYDYYFDITLSDSLGNTSLIAPAESFSTISFKTENEILIVDDTNIISGASNIDWVKYYFEEKGIPYSLWKTKTRGDIPSDIIERYNDGAVLWFCGLADSKSIGLPDIETIKHYLEKGGKLLLSGEQIPYYISLNYGASFLKDYLFLSYLSNNINIKKFIGSAGDFISDNISFNILSSQYCGEIKTYSPAQPILYYDQSSGSGNIRALGIAGLKVDTGAYKTVFLDFSWDAINSDSKRTIIMDRVLSWFGLSPVQYLKNTTITPKFLSSGDSILIESEILNKQYIQTVYADIESPDEHPIARMIMFDDGTHGDKIANDSVFSRSFLTSSEKKNYFVDIPIKLTSESIINYNNSSYFTTADKPSLEYTRYSALSGGMQPGSSSSMGFYIRNNGHETALNVEYAVEFRNEYINYYRTSATPMGTIPAGKEVMDTKYGFYIALTQNCPDKTQLTGRMIIKDASGNQTIQKITFITADQKGPFITEVSATPKQVIASQNVNISAKIVEGSGVSLAKAVITDFKDLTIAEIILSKDNDTGNYTGVWQTDAMPRHYKVKVYAKDNLGNESTSSITAWFTTIPFIKNNHILLVIPQGTYPETDTYSAALKNLGIGFDIWDKGLRGDITADKVSLYNQDTIIFSNNRIQYSYQFTTDEQQALINHLDNDGKLLLSGSYLTTFLTSYGYIHNPLLNDYLNTYYVSSKIYIDEMIGIVSDILDNDSFTLIGDLAGEIGVNPPAVGIIEANSTIDPTEILQNGFTASKIEEEGGGYRAITLNFKFSDIEFPDKRELVLKKSLSWLNNGNIGTKISNFKVNPLIGSAGSTFHIEGNIEDSTGISSALVLVYGSNSNLVDQILLFDDGNHNDNNANDSKFANQWVSSVTQDNFTVDIKIINSSGKQFYYKNALVFSTAPIPWLNYHHLVGNDPQFIINNTNYFSIYLINNGNIEANDVKVRLSTDSPYVSSISNTLFAYGNIQTGESNVKKESGSKYYVRVYSDCPNGEQIKINMDVFENTSHIFYDSFIITFYDKLAPVATGIVINPPFPQTNQQVSVSAMITDTSTVQSASAKIEDISTGISQTIPLLDDGSHQDEAENDGVFANTFLTSNKNADFRVSIFTQDNLGNSGYSSEKKYFSTKTMTPLNKILIIAQHNQDPAILTPLEEVMIKIGYGFDIWKETIQGTATQNTINAYSGGIVIWDSKSASSSSFSTQSLQNLTNYLNQGGKLILIGERNIAYITDYGRKQSEFVSDYLNAQFIQQPATQYELKGIESNPVSDGLSINLKYNRAGETDSINEAVPLFKLYPPDNWLSSGSASIAVEKSNYKSVVFDFSFDDISFMNQKTGLIDKTIEWLNVPTGPKLIYLQPVPQAAVVGQPVVISAQLTGNHAVTSVNISILDNESNHITVMPLYDNATHGDTIANDNIFSNTYTPALQNMVYYVDLTAEDDNGGAGYFPKRASFFTKSKPVFQYKYYSLKDAVVLSPGNFTYFGVTIKNAGTAQADGAQVYLDISDQYLLYNSTIAVSYGTMAVGEQKSSDTNRFRVRPSYYCPDNYMFEVSAVMSDISGDKYTAKFYMPVDDITAPYPEELILEKNYIPVGENTVFKIKIAEGSGVDEVKLIILAKTGGYSYTLRLYNDGNHSDGQSTDNIFANVFTVPYTPREYYFQIYTKDLLGNAQTWSSDKKFTSTPFLSSNRVLLLDDDGASTNVEDTYKQMLNSLGYFYDYWDVSLRGDPSDSLLTKYLGGCVLLFTGVNTSSLRISSSDQAVLTNYLNKGGNLILTGRDNSVQLTNYGSNQNTFLNNYLHAQYQGYSYSWLSFTGMTDEWITAGFSSNIPSGSTNQCDPVLPAKTILKYTTSNPNVISTAAIKVDTGLYKTIFYCFKFEDISDQNARKNLLDKSLKWILGPKITNPALSSGWVPVSTPVNIFCKVTDYTTITQVTAQIQNTDESTITEIILADNGAGADQTAADGIYSGTFTTENQQKDYLIDFTAVNADNNIGRLNNALKFSTRNIPYLKVLNIMLNEGNDFKSGTNNYFDIFIKNESGIQSSSTTVKIILDDQNIADYGKNTIIYGDIAPSQTVNKNSTAFFIHPSIKTNNNFSLEMRVISNGYNNGGIYSYEEKVPIIIKDQSAPMLESMFITPTAPSTNSIISFEVKAIEGTAVNSIYAKIKSALGTEIANIQLLDDGIHNDKQQNDFIFANNWITLAQENDYFVDIITQDTLSNTKTYSNILNFTTIPFVPSKNILLVNADFETGATAQLYKNMLSANAFEFDYWDMSLRKNLSASLLSFYSNGAVILIMGKNGAFNLTKDDYGSLRQYLLSQGNLFISGEKLSVNMENSGQSNHFLNEYLYAYSVQENTQSANLKHALNNQINTNIDINLNAQAVSGEIDLIHPAYPLFVYDTTAGGGLALSSATGAFTVFNGQYSVVFFDFCVESITDISKRNDIFIISLNWLLDTDKDGLKDAWEIQYFGSLNQTTGSDDPDMDGLTNAEESEFKSNPLVYDTDNDSQNDRFEKIAGTDPNDPQSKFIMAAISLGQTGVNITWQSVPQKTYKVYYAKELSYNGDHNMVLLGVIQASGYETSYNDQGGDWNNYSNPSSERSGFYFIKVLSD